MQIIKKKLKDLHVTDKNIRSHSEKQIKEYIRSLKMFGQIRPLVVADDGEILVGNGMFEALTEMGADECDTYVVSGLSKADKRKLMLADNKVYELGLTKLDILDDILLDLDGDFDVPGYDDSLLELLVANPLDANKEIEGYGRTEVNVTSEREDNTLQYSQTGGQSQYAPPVRTPDGEFVSPMNEYRGSAESVPEGDLEAQEGRYITCPHCGEKIWL